MKYTIGEISQIIDGDRGKNYPQQHDFFDSGYCLFLNTGNVTQSGFSFESNQFITREKCDSLRKGILQRGDIVYTTRGTVGNAALYSMTVPYDHIRINSGMVIIRPDETIVNTEFLYHILKSSYYRPFFKQYCTGSAQPQLPIKNFIKIELDIPELTKQKRIAGILSAYDDLIENNRKQIKLLEEAAQRQFKKWFVLDNIPEGWRRTNINEILTFHRGYDLTKSNMEPGPYPVIGSTSVLGYHKEYKIHGPGIVTGRSGSLGQYQFVWENFWPHNTSLYISDFKGHNIFYIFNLLQTVDFSILNNGGAIPTLNRNVLSNIEVLEPTPDLQEKYGETAAPFYRKIRTLRIQSRNLTEARDRLLPKLMSGEIEV